MLADIQTFTHPDGFITSTDPAKLDIEAIHDFLSNHSYWAQGIPKATIAKSLRHSLCFGLYRNEQQIGFARVVSDYATFAYLSDVYILEAYRAQGLSKWLMDCIIAHPSLQGLRRFILATRDAHRLYTRYGFTPLANPEFYMEILNKEIYKTGGNERLL